MFPFEERADVLCDLTFGAGHFDAVDIQFVPGDKEDICSLEKGEQSADQEERGEYMAELQFDPSLYFFGFGLFVLSPKVQWLGAQDVCLVSERGCCLRGHLLIFLRLLYSTFY